MMSIARKALRPTLGHIFLARSASLHNLPEPLYPYSVSGAGCFQAPKCKKRISQVLEHHVSEYYDTSLETSSLNAVGEAYAKLTLTRNSETVITSLTSSSASHFNQSRFWKKTLRVNESRDNLSKGSFEDILERGFGSVNKFRKDTVAI
ncbi:hypothetical protein EDC04DRAFT_3104637 [Pisolithus marmoratus]|nr:hypothetical protein EDC04DRAFT_3104637 [Pisolithus marmoratus]